MVFYILSIYFHYILLTKSLFEVFGILQCYKSKSIYNATKSTNFLRVDFYTPFLFLLERNIAIQAPFISGAPVSSSAIQGQYFNNLSQNRSESINSSNSNQTTSTTTLTPLVNARIHHPQTHQLPPSHDHHQIVPSQYTIVQQPSTMPNSSQHVNYPHALQAVLQQVPFKNWKN